MTDPTIAAQIEALADAALADQTAVNWNGSVFFTESAAKRAIGTAIVTALTQAEAAPGVVEFLEAWLSDVQRAALRGAMFIGGEWVLTTDYEDDPDIIEGLSEKLADPVSGILTPLGVRAREALARQHGAREGMVLVPREPTEAMLDAANAVNFDNEDERAMVCNLWQAMIAAAPATDAGEIK